MRSIDAANYIIANCSDKMRLTNLSLNKLVYFGQVESLRMFGRPLFSDRVEAWEYGPVEPAVYRAFKGRGRSAICVPAASGDCPRVTDEEGAAIDSAVSKYGDLTAYDLVELSHRDGGAWKSKYAAGENVEITVGDIRSSRDFTSEPDFSRTLLADIESVERDWSNTLKMLGDA